MLSGAAGLLFLTLAPPANLLTPAEEKRLEHVKLPEIVAALQAKEGHRIVDFGAGEGLYSIALAKVVGSEGTVYAIDISEHAVKSLRKRVADGALANITVIQDTQDDPKLPAGGVDSILLVDTYH